MEEEFKEVDLITLLRTFKKEGIRNFVVIRKEKFENNFIPKSKVKEKKEELEKELKEYEESDMEQDEDYFFDVNALNGEIQVLQELLGEE